MLEFSNAKVVHLDNFASDHSMLLLDTNLEVKKRKKRFFFYARWVQFQEVEGIVQNSWKTQVPGTKGFRVTQKVKECRKALSSWNKGLRLNSKLEIKRLKSELEHGNSAQDQAENERRRQLKAQLAKAYNNEEKFWAQKARIQWLKEGDRNTKYFRACVAARRKRNRISCLLKACGNWCTTDEDIAVEVEKFYKELFTSSQPDEFADVLEGIPKTITSQMNWQMTQPVKEEEIKKALFSMQPNKAPGPNAEVGEAKEIMKIIQVYGKALGQEVNIEKSSVFLSKNIGQEEAADVINQLGNMQWVQQSKYLGLPLVVGRSRCNTHQFIKDKMRKKLAGWKGKLLNSAGKETLLKSIAFALPTYAMSVFRFPNGLCKELSQEMARFWWDSGENSNNMHWKS